MNIGGKFILGTAQWGMDYGIANRSGQAREDDVRALLRLGEEAGMAWLDTAQAYGEAECLVGQLAAKSWRIVTKMPPDAYGNLQQWAEQAVRESLRRLKRTKLNALLLHRPKQRSQSDIWDTLRSMRDDGLIGMLGISAITPDDAMEALQDPDVEIMQVPASLLDQRLMRRGFFEAAKAAGKIIHLRSIFLQGVAFMKEEELPTWLQSLAPALKMADDMASGMGCPRAALFLHHALASGAQGIVIGCECAWQLRDILTMARQKPAMKQLHELEDQVAALGELPVNPALWPS